MMFAKTNLLYLCMVTPISTTSIPVNRFSPHIKRIVKKHQILNNTYRQICGNYPLYDKIELNTLSSDIKTYRVTSSILILIILVIQLQLFCCILLISDYIFFISIFNAFIRHYFVKAISFRL